MLGLTISTVAFAALVVASADARSQADCSDIGFVDARRPEVADAERRRSSATCRSQSPSAHIANGTVHSDHAQSN